MRDLFYDLVRRNGMAVAIYLMLAVSIWVFLLIILPQLTMLDYSFRFNLAARQDRWSGRCIYP